jgi:hypothetical protein
VVHDAKLQQHIFDFMVLVGAFVALYNDPQRELPGIVASMFVNVLLLQLSLEIRHSSL